MARDDDDEEEGGEVEEGGEASGGGISPTVQGLIRYVGTLVLALAVMGLYVFGTRYELGGSLKDTYKVNKLTGKVEIVSGGGSVSGTFKRGIYFLRPDQVDALKRKADKQKRDLNEVIREAVDLYLDGKKK